MAARWMAEFVKHDPSLKVRIVDKRGTKWVVVLVLLNVFTLSSRLILSLFYCHAGSMQVSNASSRNAARRKVAARRTHYHVD